MAIAAADLFGMADTFSSSSSRVQQRKHRMWLAEPQQPPLRTSRSTVFDRL